MARHGHTAIGTVLALVALPVVIGGSLSAGLGGGGGSTLPPVPVPPENPITEQKRVLGKILFWDEQLSSDNTMACGTCHIMGAAGADPVLALHPGPDGIAGTPDDMRTSFGVIRSDAADDYSPDPVFGLGRQATGRSAPTAILAMYASETFWDGRAGGEFVDPVSGAVVIASGGALENQVVGPPVSDVEMAHEARDWAQISAKLRDATPLGLATDVPADMQVAIDSLATYPALFEAAFGDDEINAARIAMAIATYERTLVPDQTPWDLFMLGDSGAMTPQQIQGWNLFQGFSCSTCHQPPLFTDLSFRNIGVRPTNQDRGRQDVTGLVQDRGRFKVPTLRNVGLKSSFMHTGDFQLIETVFNLYLGPGAPGNTNRDPLLPVQVPIVQRDPITDFLDNALTDPRVAAEQFPFDRPTLNVETPANPSQIGAGTPGSGGLIPRMISVVPPNVGNLGFKVGLRNGLGGAEAFVAISSSPPSAGVLTPESLEGPFTLDGSGSGGGFATLHWPILARPALQGDVVFMQWQVIDPGAVGGIALSRTARIELFCNGACPNTCPADMASPFGSLDFSDVVTFLVAFGSMDPSADLAAPMGVFDFSDVAMFLTVFGQGCS